MNFSPSYISNSGSEINFLMWAPTGEQVSIFGRQRANCGHQKFPLPSFQIKVGTDIFMLKNCTTSAPNTRKQTHVYKWSYLFIYLLILFFHKLLFGDIKLSDLPVTAKLYFLPITTTKHESRVKPPCCSYQCHRATLLVAYG